MAQNTTSTPTTATEQLSFPGTTELPLQFRLDRRTRERGLAHIAQIREQLRQQQPAQTNPQRAA